MSDYTFSDSVIVERSPGEVYDMVSDITRMGEWSPVCRGCSWDEGVAGPAVGVGFSGKNESDGEAWETHCQVVAADPGKEFTFVVGESWVRWSYTFDEAGGGTRLTESWEFLPDGLSLFEKAFKESAAERIAGRVQAARSGIPATLAAIKKAAEAGV